MASSEVEICNRALDAIGAPTITALTEGTRQAGICNRYFPQLRDDVLAAHPWNFAIKRAVLPALETAPAWGFDYAYQIPTDCLRVVEVEGEDAIVPPSAWQVESGSIVTDMTAPLYIRYISRVTETGLFAPLFVSALAARIAAEIAQPLTGSSDIRGRMQKEFADQMRRARSADGQEGTPLMLGADDFPLSRL